MCMSGGGEDGDGGGPGNVNVTSAGERTGVGLKGGDDGGKAGGGKEGGGSEAAEWREVVSPEAAKVRAQRLLAREGDDEGVHFHEHTVARRPR